MTTETKTLKLDQIRIDGGTQPRVAIDERVVAEYADLYASGVNLPPVTVFFDGATYWLADGFHRYWANKQIDCDYVFADVHQGTQRDAQWYSFGANSEHGLRRTRDDVAIILRKVFSDEQWSQKSDYEVAEHTGVPRSTVQRHKERYLAQVGQMDSGAREVTRNGHTFKMNTANIGHNQRSRQRFKPKPGLSPKAMTPIRGHSAHQPKTALELPHDPHWAARAVLSAMGHDFARALIQELTAYLEGATE